MKPEGFGQSAGKRHATWHDGDLTSRSNHDRWVHMVYSIDLSGAWAPKLVTSMEWLSESNQQSNQSGIKSAPQHPPTIFHLCSGEASLGDGSGWKHQLPYATLDVTSECDYDKSPHNPSSDGGEKRHRAAQQKLLQAHPTLPDTGVRCRGGEKRKVKGSNRSATWNRLFFQVRRRTCWKVVRSHMASIPHQVWPNHPGTTQGKKHQSRL